MTSDIASFDLLNEQETEAIGRCLAHCLPKGFTACFKGNLGAGKTTLIRAIIRELGVVGPIKSPTFSVVESYVTTHSIHHFDLYRLSDFQELEFMGFRDYFSSDAICFIEWPERAGNLLSYDMSIELASEEAINAHRHLHLTANTIAGQNVLASVLRTYG